MKRLQFSLRLLMLVVVLIAECLAWRHAVRSKNRAELDGKRGLIADKLAGLQRVRRNWLDSWPDSAWNVDTSLYTYSWDREIDTLSKQLAELRH